MSTADYHLSPRSLAMGCPKTTPADSPHEVHAGLQVGPGAFLNERQLCIHTDMAGVGLPTAVVALLPHFAEGLRAAAAPFEEDAPADTESAPRRRKAK